MCAQKLSFDYAHTLHTVRIVHNAHSVHRSRVQKGKSCDCINFVKATDPTCGSGGFLIKAFEYVREKIEADVKSQKEKLRASIEGDDFDSKSEKEQIKISDKIDEMQTALNTELDTSIEGSRMYQLSRNCIYGTDANPRMARTSKMNMIMHGDGHGGVHHHDGLLNVNGIFEERFNVILTNPPFGQNVDRNQLISRLIYIVNKERCICYARYTRG